MRARTTATVVLIGLLAAGCGGGGGRGAESRNMLASLDGLREDSRTFTYTDATLNEDHRITVTGKTQDDFRYSGTVSENGKDRYQMIVSDDAVALRILDVAWAEPVLKVANASDRVTGEALRAGKWVVDFTAAPTLNVRAGPPVTEDEGGDAAEAPVDVPAGRGESQIGSDPFFDAADAVGYAERAVRSGFNVERFNPESIDYAPVDDPWAEDAEKNLDSNGVLRYDLVQPPLPARAQRGRTQTLPGTEHFRKMAIYVRSEKAFEVREQLSVSDRREFRRAEEGRSAEYYTDLRDAARSGAVSDPLRERTMAYAVEDADIEIKLPANAVNGILADVMGERGLKSMFKFKMIGEDDALTLPGGVDDAPVPVPAGTPAPAASPAAG